MKLFVYGRLEHPHERFNACAYGELRIREPGGDAAAQFDKESPFIIYGQVHDITDPQLHTLDHIESPEYVRRVIELCDGEYAYAYECVCPEFESWELVPDGKYVDPTKTR